MLKRISVVVFAVLILLSGSTQNVQPGTGSWLDENPVPEPDLEDLRFNYSNGTAYLTYKDFEALLFPGMDKYVGEYINW